MRAFTPQEVAHEFSPFAPHPSEWRTPTMRLSDRIRAARLRMGWSQSELAAMLTVDRSAVGHWERGDGSEPSTARLVTLAGLTGVCVDWLATGAGPMLPIGDTAAAPQLSADELRLIQGFRRRDGSVRALIMNLAETQLSPPPANKTPGGLIDA
jgi:transcriptional regulator with XRE-family HTH domain